MGVPITIVEVPPFDRLASTFMTEDELDELKYFIAMNPEAGSLIRGTGGIRKVRWSASGKGKRGGARVIYYYHSDEVPLFLLMAYAKSKKGSLNAAEKNQLRKLARQIAEHYTKRE